jgi:hypothetical protein
MRVLMVTATPPYLPAYDRVRLLPAQLLAHLSARHSLAVVTADTQGETPVQLQWAAALGVPTLRVHDNYRLRGYVSATHVFANKTGLTTTFTTVDHLVGCWLDTHHQFVSLFRGRSLHFL